MMKTAFEWFPRFWIIVCALQIGSIHAVRFGADGSCTLYGFVPFTAQEDYSCAWGCPNDGFMHMAATMMAVEHFNNRSSPVVDNLRELTADCPVYFDDLQFYDTGVSHQGIQSLWKRVSTSENRPCVAVGPYSDLSAIELGTMAAAMEFPLVVNRANSFVTVMPWTAPFTTQIYPSVPESCATTAGFLREIGRKNYVAFIFPLTPTGTQWREIMGLSLDHFDIDRHVSVPYDASFKGTEPYLTYDETMKHVKDSGYRTIVLTMEHPKAEFPGIAKAAEKAGLTNGEYLWVIVGNYDASFMEQQDTAGRKLLEGSMWVLPSDDSLDEEKPFLQSFRNMDASFVNRLNKLNPVQNEHDLEDFPNFGYAKSATPGYVYAKPDFLNNSAGGSLGSGYSYDAVMTAGIGACKAWKNSQAHMEGSHRDIAVEKLVEGFHAVRFNGVTGLVQFGGPHAVSPSTRMVNTALFEVWNILPQSAIGTGLHNMPVQPFYKADHQGFETVGTPYYADGRTVPPDLLRDTPQQNYLSPGLRSAAFVMCGISMALSAVAAVWIILYREHRVLRAAQPVFLVAICLGAFIFSTAIILLSFDENSGLSLEQLDRMCVALPWVLAIGHIATYGALSAKLWRINRVLQMTRRKIGIHTVIWPSALLMAAALVILTVWTVVAPMEWVRTTIDDDTGESCATCSTDNVYFVLPILLVMIIPTYLTGYMAYKTKDIDNEYSESRWIFIMVLVQAEAILFYTPTMVVLQDLTPEVKFVGFVLVIWTFPISTIVFMVGPKFARFMSKGANQPVKKRGTSSGQIRVSGLQTQSSVRSLMSGPGPQGGRPSLVAQNSVRSFESLPPSKPRGASMLDKAIEITFVKHNNDSAAERAPEATDQVE